MKNRSPRINVVMRHITFCIQLILCETPSAIIVGDDLNGTSVFLHEAFITGILMFYAVATAVDDSYDQPLGALAVGLTVFQGIIAGYV